MIDEADVRRLLAGKRAKVLYRCTEKSWRQYLKDGRSRRPTARAAVVWDNMLALLERKFVPLPGVTQVYGKNSRMPIYVVDSVLSLRPKKHDSDGQTRNYPTRHAASVRQNGTIETHDMLDGTTHYDHLTFGYELDAAEAGISGFPITRTVGGRVEWSFDLREIIDPEALGSLEPMFPPLPLDLPKLPTISRPAKPAEESE
jgi:hypothetical protein